MALLAALVLGGPRSGSCGEAAPGLRISVEQPAADTHSADGAGALFVAGRVFGSAGPPQPFDVLIALDTSASAAAPAGADVDGDGLLGLAAPGRFSDGRSSDPGDSALAAQLAAVRALLEQADPETTRLGLLTFAGGSGTGQPAVRLRVELTREWSALERVLGELERELPRGRTDLAAALQRAGAELLAAPPERDGSEVRRVVLLLGDSEPTLPNPREPDACAEQARAAARELAQRGVRIDSATVGDPAGRGPQLAAELAQVTGGRSTQLRDPRDFVAALEDLEWVSVASLELENRTSGALALATAVEGDGRFTALLPLVPGENLLQIRARASDGRRSQRWLRVLRAPDAESARLDPRWLAARRRLLEGRLAELRGRAIALEARRAAQLRAGRAAERRAVSVTARAPVPDDASAVPASRAPAP